jgi:hypothetical protein
VIYFEVVAFFADERALAASDIFFLVAAETTRFPAGTEVFTGTDFFGETGFFGSGFLAGPDFLAGAIEVAVARPWVVLSDAPCNRESRI